MTGSRRHILLCFIILLFACNSCLRLLHDAPVESVERARISFSIHGENLALASEPELKGSLVTDDNLFPVYVSAYTPDGQIYFDKVMIGASSQIDPDEYDSGYLWPDASLGFVAANVDVESSRLVSDFSFNPVTSTASFKCHLVDTLYADDARHLKDYVFAMTLNKSESDGVVPLDFHHCFSAVSFKINQFPYETNRIVKSVSIMNVQSAATCRFGPDMEFIWDDYTAEFVDYKQAINQFVPDGGFITEGENLFMMIPQDLSADAAICVLFYMHDTEQRGHEMVVTYKIQSLTPKWEPGHRYVYSISYDGQCSCEQD